MFYDLHCKKCGRDSYDINATVAEKVEKRIPCPECGSNEMETIFSPISVHVKNSDTGACPNISTCGSCCHRQPA